MKGEKVGNLDPTRLHYLSVGFVDDVEFGKARLACELTDLWLDKKLDMPGCSFKSEPPTLSQGEIDKIPGAAVATGSVDRLKLEVCVRDGAKICIKPDEDRYWRAQGGVIAEEYQTLKDDHEKNFEKLLANIIKRPQSGGSSEPNNEPPEEQADTSQDSALIELESLEKLKETDTISEDVVSEVPDVNILRCESGKVFLLAKKDKALTKYTQLGGFGTGAYISTSDPTGGVAWNVTSDKSLIQVDDSTLRADATSTTVMSLYKLLVTLEKTKRVTDHKISYLDVKRKEESEEELDGFTVSIRNPQKFKPMKNPSGREEKNSCKNVFSRCVDSVENSSNLVVVFRFRYERVGGTVKVQKPYVITSRALQLSKGKPVQARIRVKHVVVSKGIVRLVFLS